VLSGEATDTNLIVIGLTRPGLDNTSYRIQDEHENYYTTETVLKLKSYDKKSTILPISISRVTTFHLKSLNTKKRMAYADGSVFFRNNE
jgi:hypothetical protein